LRKVALLAALAVVGCGGDGSGQPRLVVSAASSMTEALNACSPLFADASVRLSFAGSDELAAQIRQGVKPDVYAAANTKLPDALHDEGLLSAPVKFATNELVLAVPKDSSIASVEDLAAAGVKLAIGSESVPIGSYTRDTLAKLPAAQAKAILANVRSNEPDVKGIVGKLTQGAVDAGFVYVTDVKAARGELKAIELPSRLEPRVTYEAGVVKGAKHPEQAQAYLDGLLDGTCAGALRGAGFGPAP
jgi:molybdate transport system substrate-binding protein